MDLFATAGNSSAPLRDAEKAIVENRLLDAERIAREVLARAPADGRAMQVLAEVAARAGRLDHSERLFAQALALGPEQTEARFRYAIVLWQQNKLAGALAQLDLLLAASGTDTRYRDLKASILAQIGKAEEAVSLYQSLVMETEAAAPVWIRYANVLRAAGRLEDSIAAYRKAAVLQPDLGEAYCSLANLKTYRFEPEETDRMREQLARGALTRESRAAFHFALGKALRDANEHAEAFENYAAGNALWRSGLTHDRIATSNLVIACQTLFAREFFAARNGTGCEDNAPIFIVGMPRAGSTLVEQILASHSQIEGGGELPDIMLLATGLDRGRSTRYPRAVEELAADELYQLGAQYIQNTKIYRHRPTPFFTDKMPNNFLHIGLIHLILPNAKIVDVRRGAMACCFSNFTHHFARGQQFTYDLGELGQYYADYVRLMAHYENVLPGRIHRVQYENLIEDPEREVRDLFSYLNLPFEADCLRFFESKRSVRSASSEQVRLPLFRDSIAAWRPYECWLAPLKETLGPLAEEGV